MNVWALVATAGLYFLQAGSAGWVRNWPIAIAFVAWAIANLALAYNLK